MIVYFSMLLLSAFFMHLARKQTSFKLKVLFYILSFLPFFLVSGFRYAVGTDYFKRYVYDFNRTLSGYEVPNLEIGFRLLMKATMLVTDKPYLMFQVTSFLINGFIFLTISKESKAPVLSICIYFFLGFFFDSLNIMRQYLAMSFIFIGFYYLLKNKKLLYVISVVLASLFHSTAIIMLVLVVLDYKFLCSPKWFIPFLILVLVLNTRLMSLLALLLQNTRFNVYFSGKLFKGEVSYLFIGENLAFYLLMLYLRHKGYVSNNKQANLYLNTQSLALLCMCLGTVHMLFIRIALYFSVFQILSVPYYVSRCRKTYRLSLRDKPVYLDILKIAIVCCMMLAFYRTNIQTNVNEVIPYRPVFAPTWRIY